MKTHMRQRLDSMRDKLLSFAGKFIDEEDAASVCAVTAALDAIEQLNTAGTLLDVIDTLDQVEAAHPNKPAVCGSCGRPMTGAVGCAFSHLHIDDKILRRIPMGEDSLTELEGACDHCGAAPGRYHHHGCEDEQCPGCFKQLASCDCEGCEVADPQEVE